MSGIYLVTTPIGNEKDITLRALEVLRDASCVYCEDTRVFKDLCRRVEITYSDKMIRSFHDHSGNSKLDEIMSIAQDTGCAFVSDAGSPLVSDPAFPIIKEAISRGIEIHSCGGISSVIVALELSGLPATPFHFHGFLARTKIRTELEALASQYGTHVFFEGVSRVIETLSILSSLYPDSEIAVGRELTKNFESIHRFKGSEFEEIKANIVVKGEFVVLFYNESKTQVSSKEINSLAGEILEKGMKPKLVAKLLAQITGDKVKDIYQKIQNER